MPKSTSSISTTRTVRQRVRFQAEPDLLQETSGSITSEVASGSKRKRKCRAASSASSRLSLTCETESDDLGVRTVSTTVEPTKSSVGVQLINCSSCGELGHVDSLCDSEAPSSRPRAVTCTQCRHAYSYKTCDTGSEILVAEIRLCSAHKRQIVDKSTSLIPNLASKVRALLDIGTPLKDALEWLNISEDDYHQYLLDF